MLSLSKLETLLGNKINASQTLMKKKKGWSMKGRKHCGKTKKKSYYCIKLRLCSKSLNHLLAHATNGSHSRSFCFAQCTFHHQLTFLRSFLAPPSIPGDSLRAISVFGLMHTIKPNKAMRLRWNATLNFHLFNVQPLPFLSSGFTYVYIKPIFTG